MSNYDEDDYSRDQDTVENGGEWGVSYGADWIQENDVDEARERMGSYED